MSQRKKVLQILGGISIFLLVFAGCDENSGEDSNNGNNNGTDNAPPSISNGSPSGVLQSGTTSALLSITTDTDAICNYDTTNGRDYTAMNYTFSTSGGSTHSTGISDFTDGQTFNFHIRCQDGAGNVITADYIISFSVNSAASGGLIFSNDMETGTLSSIFTNDVNILGATVELSTDNSYSGSRSIKIGFPYDETGVSLSPGPFPPTTSLFTRKYVYYALG